MSAIAIDTETTGAYLRRGCKPFMVSACDSEGYCHLWTFRVNPHTREPIYDRETIQSLQSIITKYDTWVFHNALFDIQALSLIPWDNLDYDNFISHITIEDTMLMAHCQNSLDRMGLKGLALMYLGFSEGDERELDHAVTKCRSIAKRLNWAIADPSHSHLTPLKEKKGKCDFWLPAEVSFKAPESLPEGQIPFYGLVCGKYAIGDVERTMGLYLLFQKILSHRGDLKHYHMNRDCILPTHRIQNQGFHIKKDKLPKLVADLTEEKIKLQKGMERISLIEYFNPRSPIQLFDTLFNRLKLDPTKYTEKGKPSTDKEAIHRFLDEDELTKTQEAFCRRLLTYRQLNTAGNYLESYIRHEVNGYLYTNLNITGTTTTRYSHRDPNAGNISKQSADEDSLNLTLSFNLREAFGPPPGKLWVCIDYAQLQLRIFAYACQDQFLINAFQNGLDIHDIVAKEVFRTEEPTSLERRAAKAINFGIIFGAGPSKIERMSKVEGSYKLFKDRFPLVDQYLKKCEREVRKTGMVRTLGGYPLRVQKAKAYKGCNFVVQGTEGEMVKRAIASVDEYCLHSDVPLKPIMMIHDEIIFETKKKVSKQFLIKHYEHCLLHLFDLMNQAGDSVYVKTAVDCKITSTTWAEAQSWTPISNEVKG